MEYSEDDTQIHQNIFSVSKAQNTTKYAKSETIVLRDKNKSIYTIIIDLHILINGTISIMQLDFYHEIKKIQQAFFEQLHKHHMSRELTDNMDPNNTQLTELAKKWMAPICNNFFELYL